MAALGDAATFVEDASASPCPLGWIFEPGVCVRWREVAAPPAGCPPEILEVGQGFYSGAPLLRCGERGFGYDTIGDRWVETAFSSEPADDWSATLPPLEGPSDQRLSAPLFSDYGLLVLTTRPYAVEWTARRWDTSSSRWTETADLPPDFFSYFTVSFSLGVGQVLAIGPRSWLYEIAPVP